jgi:hypothetical protein
MSVLTGVQTWWEGGLRPSGLKCYNLPLHALVGTEEQQHALMRDVDDAVTCTRDMSHKACVAGRVSGYGTLTSTSAYDIGEMASSAPS